MARRSTSRPTPPCCASSSTPKDSASDCGLRIADLLHPRRRVTRKPEPFREHLHRRGAENAELTQRKKLSANPPRSLRLCGEELIQNSLFLLPLSIPPSSIRNPQSAIRNLERDHHDQRQNNNHAHDAQLTLADPERHEEIEDENTEIQRYRPQRLLPE